ncbi:unnamed protein product [Hymenolepis diminuta]|uniref:Zinc finger protein ZPR1 n=1 Tax=Hymenolepis diminuta TaxID=6216 RepID=A0A0R3SPL5_HYMDI|nr:unnamed protein product [Hymenolepis diminuta]VUZ55449.1 unnamed protein product [Hymenolepis diminuta]
MDMSENGSNVFEPTVKDLNQESGSEVIQTESYCLNCRRNGMTRLLITRIPFFREVVISSFECEHCGFKNNSVDPAAPIQNRGKKFTVDVRCAKDLNRRVIQPCFAEIRIPSLESAFPSSESILTTVEGIITGIIEKLEMLQPERRSADPKQAEAIDAFIKKLRDLLTLKTPFTLEMDDPSGNGFIENLHAPLEDPQVTCITYKRTLEQNKLLGFQDDDATTALDDDDEPEDLKNSVSTFHANCPNCHSNCPTNMKVIDIPYFQEVVLMSINCSLCGYRNNEVKSVAGISKHGKRFTLFIADIEDMSRDVLKSDTARIAIPELELDTVAGTLGGRFTTVEGLLGLIKDQLKSMNPLMFGDSAAQEEKMGYLNTTCDKIDEILALSRRDVHLVLDDPAGNSYLQSLNPDGVDERLVVEEYTRTREQDEELGILDMNTENYTS